MRASLRANDSPMNFVIATNATGSEGCRVRDIGDRLRGACSAFGSGVVVATDRDLHRHRWYKPSRGIGVFSGGLTYTLHPR